jgi:hypothetical protein
MIDTLAAFIVLVFLLGSALIVGGLFALAIIRRFTGAAAALLSWRPNMRLWP